MEAIIKVSRLDSLGETPGYDSFTVQVDGSTTVLTALLQIKDEQDESLAFRRSCRSGVCGSCAITINGRAGLACKTRVVDRLAGGRELVVEPLRYLPVIRDLVVDLAAFWQGLESVRPWLTNQGPFPPIPHVQSVSEEQMERLDRLIDCNLCAACHSECLPSGVDPSLPGAVAFAKVYRFILDPRDGLGEARIAERIGAGLSLWCDCPSEVCPRGVKLQEALSQMCRTATQVRHP